MDSWDHVTDFLVVGSGGGGLTAALAARDLGLDTLVIEKSAYFGGDTATSGGAIWAPNNHLMGPARYRDSPEAALNYLKILTRGKVCQERLRAYVGTIPEMVRDLEESSHVRFRIVPEYPDYYAHVEGSKPEGGRTLEPETFSLRRLEKGLRPWLRLPPAQALVFGRMMITAVEGRVLVGSSLGTRLRLARTFGSYFLNPLRCMARTDTRLTLGNALIGRLRLSLAERGVPVWLRAPARRLIREKGRVTGVEAKTNMGVIRIRANKGILLAAGGFEKNQAMREQYQRNPLLADWSMGIPENTGDGIQMGLEVGGVVDFMEDAWWMPTTLIPGPCMPWVVEGSWWGPIAKTDGAHLPWFSIVERSLPGSILVDEKGRRYTNEAGPYIDVVRDQLVHHDRECRAVPAHLIVDHRYRRRYPIGPVLPGFSIEKFVQNGFLKRSNSIEGLAEACGIDPEGLAEEVNKYNQFAVAGKDPDFRKGDNPIDRYYADPAVKPNPCLATIDKPPFYAMKMYPGDIGTRGGLKTDAFARVLRGDDSPIQGLYATGNCSSPVMGDTYPGAGATIGPSMTFGYIAAHHASKR